MTRDERTNENVDYLIDLLVDGELRGAERSYLLTAIDDEPDAWRRCALAFLEERELKDGIGRLARGDDGEEEPVETGGRQIVRIPGWTRIAAAAAVLAAAFMLGTFFSGLMNGEPPERVQPGGVAESSGNAGAGTPAKHRATPAGSDAAMDDSPAEQPGARPAWELVTGTDRRPLPILEADRVDETLFASLPDPIPASVIRSLRERGHTVRRQRELMPYRLDDGTELVIPVDSYDIKPADYQPRNTTDRKGEEQ